MCAKGRKPVHEVYEEFNMMFKGHEDLLMEFVSFLPARNAIMHHKGTAISAMHPIQSDKVKQYPVEIPGYKNALGKKSVNAHLVSSTLESEDNSFNHMPKNQYEESLFWCEDHRYEVDMLLSWISSAIEKVKILLKKITNNIISIDTPICIEKHLSVWDLRCIEQLYGDDGLLVMDHLKKNVQRAIPVILTRLEQKQEDWRRCLTDFQKVWADVYAKNHRKSRDHQTLYFKQQDSKKLNTKCLVEEILNERYHQDDLLQAVVVRTVPSFTPDLEFRYCDSQIHEDLYLLIKYYCEETCTTEQSDKVMNLWINFLEPMFGIISRSPCNQAMEVVSKFKNNQEFQDPRVEMKDSLNEVSVRKYEREEGDLSPTYSCEQDNIEVNGPNGLNPSQRVINNVRSNKDQKVCDKKGGAYCTGAKSNSRAEDDKKGNFHKQSEDNETVPDMVVSEHYLQTVKPVAKHAYWPLQASETGSQDDSQVFYGNDSYYVIFRLHQMLYEKIQYAKKHSEKKFKAPDNTPPDSYPRFMDALYYLLDGSSDNTKFEDKCRAIFGSQSYVLFTLDKLVHKFVKHLHVVASDETDTKLLQLYAYENCRKPERLFDIVYHENARALLHEANIYRIRYSSAETRLSIQLMNSWNDHLEVTGVATEPDFANYLQNELLTSIDEEENRGLFLKRNKKKLTGLDESSGMAIAMEGLNIINELECVITCSSSKMKYAANTSDMLYRSKQRKPNLKGPVHRRVSEISKQKRISRCYGSLALLRDYAEL
ncbi:unnamed protein product [Cochlearia groenlandica]